MPELLDDRHHQRYMQDVHLDERRLDERLYGDDCGDHLRSVADSSGDGDVVG
jgi:hypothetical protein